MDSIILRGYIYSDLKALRTKQGTIFCKFMFGTHDKEYECWFVGKDAARFAYDVEKGTTLVLTCIVNDKMQIGVHSYEVVERPIRLGQVFDSNNNQLLVTEDLF